MMVKKNDKIKEENKMSYEQMESKLIKLESLLESLVDKKSAVNNVANIITKEDLEEDEDEYVEIVPNKRIKIVSLHDGILVLVAGEYGSGKPYYFNKFGEIKNINYSDLTEVLHYHMDLAEKGYFYICNKNVVSNHGLKDTYQNILSKEVIENILSLDRIEMLSIFNSTTDEQKDTIASLIIEKIRNNEDVDLNKIDALSRSYGRSIVEMAEDTIADEEE